MSAAAATATPAIAARRSGAAAGTSALLRFMLRRERRGLPWWLLGIAFLVGYQSVGSQNLYDTPEKLAQLRETLGANPAMVAMSGPGELLNTIGGEVIFEIFSYVGIVVALMNMFLIGRHTRADEETGRAELIRSARVGRSAILAAALALAGIANTAVALVVLAAAAGTGLPVGGSVLVALAVAGVGATFAALTAVGVQVFDSPRAVYGAVGAALGAAYILRAAGDAGNGTLSWFSPIGWGQQTLPYVQDRWWPLLIPVVATTALVGLAVLVLGRRDFGAGLLASRLGRATASAALGSSLGLAWRLQRGALIGWTVGLWILGAAYGSITDTIEEYIADNPELAVIFPGGPDSAVNAYLAVTTMFTALLAGAYGVTSALRARGEETAGRADLVLATRTSRPRWLSSHVIIALAGSMLALLVSGLGSGLAYAATISDPSQIPRLVAVALVYVPAMWVIVAVAVLGYGWVPRAAGIIAWVILGFCAFVAIFADLVDLPGWLRDISPFAHTPQAPLEPVTATPMLVIAAIVAAILAAGYIGFRQRDIGHSGS